MGRIILASTSRYRRKLLCDAGFDAVCVAPDYEEVAVPGLTARELVSHHARGKAASLMARYPEDMVIGADQGLVDGDILVGKPLTPAKACEQLMSFAGRELLLVTSHAVVCGGRWRESENVSRLRFRGDLTEAMVRGYVAADMPLDCAGSFKIESRGVRLFESIECSDPSAIQGISLMALTRDIVAFDPGYNFFW